MGDKIDKLTDRMGELKNTIASGAKRTVSATGAAIAGGASATVNNLTEGGVGWFFLAILLTFLDWGVPGTSFEGLGFKGIDATQFFSAFSSIPNFWKLVIWNTWTMAALILYAYYLLSKQSSREDKIYTALLLFVLSLIGKFAFSFPALLHVAFGLSAMYWLFYPYFGNITEAKKVTILLLFIDFFVFSWISAIPNLDWITSATFPIWAIFAALYTRPSFLKKLVTYGIILMYIFSLPAAYLQYKNFKDSITEKDRAETRKFYTNVWTNAGNFWGNLKKEVTNSWNDTRRTVSGEDFYASQVDTYSTEPLGVFLEDVEAGDEKYQAGDTVSIAGRLKVSSIEDTVTATIRCYAKDSDDNLTKGRISPVKGSDEYESTINFRGNEEEYIICNLDDMPKGSYEVGFNVTFTFTTQGYLKTYFMDKEKKRAMVAKKIDPFQYFGITDTLPTSIHTAGPIELGIGSVNTLPVGVNTADPNDFSASLGISLKNLNEGKIKKIDSITMHIPKGLRMDEKDCNTKIEGGKCTETCTIPKSELQRNSLQEIEGKTFRCNLRLDDAGLLLGSTPISIRYYRAEANYTYQIEETVAVTVEKIEEEETTNTTADATKIAEGGKCSGTEGTCKTNCDSTTGESKVEGNNECANTLFCCNRPCENPETGQTGGTCLTAVNNDCPGGYTHIGGWCLYNERCCKKTEATT